MCDAPIMFSSLTQKYVILLMTKAAFTTVLAWVENMMPMYHVVIYMELAVDLSLLVELDNSM